MLHISPRPRWKVSSTLQILLAIASILAAMIYMGHFRLVLLVELTLEICLYEYNVIRAKRCRSEYLSGLSPSSNTKYLACIIGRREDPRLFNRCLRSNYGDGTRALLVVGVDGCDHEDFYMVRTFQRVR